ncbi:MAG TPA: ATP-binding protein, partial [Polyangiaceae bacterium]
QAYAAQQTLDAILSCVPEGITVVNADGVTLLTSRYGDALLLEGFEVSKGLSLEAWLDKVEHFLPDGSTPAKPEDLPLWKAIHHGATSIGQELIVRRPNGKRLSVSCNAAPIRDVDGAITGAVVAWRDISERQATKAAIQKSEQARRTSERIYRAIGESIDFGIWICAPDGRNLYASQSFLDLVGITQQECSDFGWGNILHPDDSERTVAAWKQCVQTLDKWDMEHRYRRVDGTYHPVLARGVPVRNEQGDVECWAGINLDIARLKATEERLQLKQRRLEVLSTTASRLLAATDPLAAVQDLCSEVMQHLDCQAFFNFVTDPPSGRLRLNAWAGIPEDEARRIAWLDYGVAVCGCVARDQLPAIAEDVLHSSDGRTELIRSYGIQAYCCHPLQVGGKVVGTLSFGTTQRTTFDDDEVTLMQTVADQVATAMQRLLSLQELSAANARLREADRQKSQFLAVLSHELRNPLTPIRNSLHLLDRCAPGGDQSNRARLTIERQVNQLARIIDDLLEVTRLTSGKLRLERSRLDLVELVRRTAEDHRVPFERSSIRFECDFSPVGPIWVFGDSSRLSQAVSNLLANAAKFTPKQGTVTLGVYRADALAVVRVKDTGVGIPNDMLHQLFEPFVQADRSLEHSQGGLGLGLSLVKGIVEMHGGTVEAHSDGPDQGAEFVLTLPVEHQAAFAPDQTTPSAPPSRRRVLIVEDNVDGADSLRDLLEFDGHQVEVARSGPDGVEKARALKPDLVLCDIGLPGFDGYTVAKLLRADPALATTRLVALSGYAQPDDVRLAKEAGFDEHLAKPPTLERLDALLKGANGIARPPLS